jgi:hypothetical protein
MVIYENSSLNVAVAYEHRGGALYLWAVADGVPDADSLPDAVVVIPAVGKLSDELERSVVAAFADGVCEGRRNPEQWQPPEPVGPQWANPAPVETDHAERVICPQCGHGMSDSTERCGCPA